MSKFSSIVIAMIALSVIAGNAGAVPVEEWSRSFDGTEIRSVQQTPDGGYILAGWTWSKKSDLGNLDGLLIKTDAKGNKQWGKTFGGAGDDLAHSVQQTTDSGYIFAGWTSSSSPYLAGDYDIWLTRTDVNGNEIWNKTFRARSPQYILAVTVRRTSDSGYIISGWTGGFIWLIKTDADGNQQWDRLFGGHGGIFERLDYAYSIQQTIDGGYILAGETFLAGDTAWSPWLIKTDADGKEQWNRTFVWDISGRAYSVQQTIDGGYILAGDRLMKTDVNGNEQWNREFGGKGGENVISEAHSVNQTSDGGYVFAGSIYTEHWKALIIKTDANGNEQWSKTFEGNGANYGYSVQQTLDGGYIFAGTSYKGGNSGWLIKVGGESADSTEKAPGFEAALAITILLLVVIIREKRSN